MLVLALVMVLSEKACCCAGFSPERVQALEPLAIISRVYAWPASPPLAPSLTPSPDAYTEVNYYVNPVLR